MKKIILILTIIILILLGLTLLKEYNKKENEIKHQALIEKKMQEKFNELEDLLISYAEDIYDDDVIFNAYEIGKEHNFISNLSQFEILGKDVSLFKNSEVLCDFEETIVIVNVDEIGNINYSPILKCNYLYK